MLRLLVLIIAFSATATASAQDWPAKPVRIIVPFPPGGSADLMPRIVAEKLAGKFGQPVIVENRPGAAGNIGANAVYHADPDGYTLLSAPPPPLVINRLLYPEAFLRLVAIRADHRDWRDSQRAAGAPQSACRFSRRAHRLAKANPGKLNYSSQGSGTTSHLTAELFKCMAGGRQIAIMCPTRAPPRARRPPGGQVDLMCDNLGVSLPHVKRRKFKALAVASAKRVNRCPTCPRLPNAAGVRGRGLVRHRRAAGLPAPIAEKIAAA